MLFFKIWLFWHVNLYRLTGGRIGSRMFKNDVLLLTTIGRKSGKKRTTPLMYLRDGDKYLVTASAGGDPKHPGWYWNATQGSAPVGIQVRGHKMTVKVEEAAGDQRTALYQRFIQSHPGFADYEKKVARTIPVLILTPVA